jgi:hypothetical protein
MRKDRIYSVFLPITKQFIMRKLHILSAFLLMAWASVLRSQPVDMGPPPAFPDSWAGTWTGTLEIFNGTGRTQTVQMQLEIHRIDTSRTGRYVFGLVYGSKDMDWRPYELVPVDASKGLWRIDEKNSIVMESYLYGPKLLCWFTVQQNRILCTYEKMDDNSLVFEVFSGQEIQVSTTGGAKMVTEEIPIVKTYPFSVFQRAILKRKP